MKKIIDEINKLKKEKNAVILVHNYQRPEIYKIADFIGDSYGLSVEASKTNADIIVFCGVHFMAESAYILNPDKKVLLPAIHAGCPMADMVDLEDLRNLKKKYPGAAVVSYMNTTAETKAESDVICTSSNAIKVVNSLPNKQIIFVPDLNLANYVSKHTDKEIIPWDGYCYVHAKFKFSDKELETIRKVLPGAKIVAHPECPEKFRGLADHICSTSGMVDYAKNSEAEKFIIGTEVGMLERLKQECPGKKFYSPQQRVCFNMKKNTLELVLKALREEQPVITVPENIRVRAKKALERMMEVGK